MQHRTRIFIILLLAVIGAFISGLLLLQHYSQAEASALVNMLCGGNSTSGCDEVNRSSYSSMSGIPVAAIGVMYYLFIALLSGFSMLGDETTVSGICKWLLPMTGLAFLTDLLLLSLQIFSIRAFCILCISTYAITLIMFGLLMQIRKSLNEVSWGGIFQAGTNRIIMLATILASVIMAIAVLSVNYAISFKDPAILEERLSQSAWLEYQSSPIRNIDLTGVPFSGNQNSPIKVVIFSDFLCPYCRQMATYFQQYLPRWKDKVVLYYINYPLDRICNVYRKETVHEGSCWVAMGGVCADIQGKFWLYHDYVYNKKIINPGYRDIIRFGKDLGMDTTAIQECLFSTPLRERLRAQIDNASSLDVTSTPRIFINGRMLPKIGYLQSIIGKEAERLGIGPLEGLNE